MVIIGNFDIRLSKRKRIEDTEMNFPKNIVTMYNMFY